MKKDTRFNPYCGDERCEEGDRVEQVWFAGVHLGCRRRISEKPARAGLALDWMLSKVVSTQSSQGLHFIQSLRNDIKRQSDWHGVQHNSRSGIRAFYRYKPRNISQLCKSNGINSPKIHLGAMKRIEQKCYTVRAHCPAPNPLLWSIPAAVIRSTLVFPPVKRASEQGQ